MDLYLGGVMTPRSAVLLDVSINGAGADPHLEGDVRIGARRGTFNAASSLTSFVFAGALQYWAAPRVWVRGGAGVGSLDRDIEITDADLTITLDQGYGAAVVAAAGVEVWRQRNFALDAQFHYTTFALKGLRIHAPSFQFGLTWG